MIKKSIYYLDFLHIQLEQSQHSLLASVRYFLKNYGLIKTIKISFHPSYLKLKQRSIDIENEHTIEVNGCKLVLMPNDKGISSELLAFGIHEPLSTMWISEILQEGMYCIDMSANIGYFAVLESKLVGGKGKVIAVEPSPKTFECLKKNSQLQPTKNMELYNFAFSDSYETVDFIVDQKSNLSRIVDNPNHYDSNNIIKVETKPLDSFIEEIGLPKVNFLRMDIEGYEYKIYNGMKKTLEQFKPYLLMEFHKFLLGIEKSKKFLQNLQNLGYEVKFYVPRRLDYPLISQKENMRDTTIDGLLNALDENKIPSVFSILFENSKNGS